MTSHPRSSRHHGSSKSHGRPSSSSKGGTLPSSSLLHGSSKGGTLPSSSILHGSSKGGTLPSSSLLHGSSKGGTLPSSSLLHGSSKSVTLPSSSLLHGFSKSVTLPSSSSLLHASSKRGTLPSSTLLHGPSKGDNPPSSSLLHGSSSPPLQSHRSSPPKPKLTNTTCGKCQQPLSGPGGEIVMGPPAMTICLLATCMGEGGRWIEEEWFYDIACGVYTGIATDEQGVLLPTPAACAACREPAVVQWRISWVECAACGGQGVVPATPETETCPGWLEQPHNEGNNWPR